MEHYLIRATIIPVIVEKIMDRFDIDYLNALDRFYTSDTAALLSDDDTGLYGQSPNYIFGLYLQEVIK
ncbi:MAG: hypothetical protein ACI4VF_00855 [Lachnospirales bacterium]